MSRQLIGSRFPFAAAPTTLVPLTGFLDSQAAVARQAGEHGSSCHVMLAFHAGAGFGEFCALGGAERLTFAILLSLRSAAALDLLALERLGFAALGQQSAVAGRRIAFRGLGYGRFQFSLDKVLTLARQRRCFSVSLPPV